MKGALYFLPWEMKCLPVVLLNIAYLLRRQERCLNLLAGAFLLSITFVAHVLSTGRKVCSLVPFYLVHVYMKIVCT